MVCLLHHVASIPYVSHHSPYVILTWLLNVRGTLRKLSTFGLRLLCFTLFVEHNLLYWHCYCIWHVWYFMQDMYIWLWMLHIAHGVCSYMIISSLTSLWRNFWLDLSTDANLLEVLWVSFILAQLLQIFIRLVLHYLFSSIFILHSCLIVWWDLYCWYMSRGPLVFLSNTCVVFAVDWWVTQFRNWDHNFALISCSL